MAKPSAAPAQYVGAGLLVTPDMTRAEARHALIEAGFVFVGGGSFTGVVLSPDGTRAVRISKPDLGSERAYTVFSRPEHSDDPDAPRVYGMIYLENGGTAIEVEPLQKRTRKGWRSYFEVPRGSYESDADSELVAALRDQTWDYDVKWDLHSENVMERADGELVMADPLYAPSQHWNRSGTARTKTGVVGKRAFEESAAQAR